MRQPLVPHRFVLSLVAAAILLPILVCIIVGVAALLSAMGDTQGGAILPTPCCGRRNHLDHGPDLSGARLGHRNVALAR